MVQGLDPNAGGWQAGDFTKKVLIIHKGTIKNVTEVSMKNQETQQGMNRGEKLELGTHRWIHN